MAHHSHFISLRGMNMLGSFKEWPRFCRMRLWGHVQGLCQVQKFQVLTSCHQLLLLLSSLQWTRFRECWDNPGVDMQETWLQAVLLTQIPLWAQFYWAMLGLCNTDLPSKSRLVMRRHTGKKYACCVGICSLEIHALLC
jgi:hypothetical protein